LSKQSARSSFKRKSEGFSLKTKKVKIFSGITVVKMKRVAYMHK
jgi:hypothetical protein